VDANPRLKRLAIAAPADQERYPPKYTNQKYLWRSPLDTQPAAASLTTGSSGQRMYNMANVQVVNPSHGTSEPESKAATPEAAAELSITEPSTFNLYSGEPNRKHESMVAELEDRFGYHAPKFTRCWTVRANTTTTSSPPTLSH
jgi:hypothetical protein